MTDDATKYGDREPVRLPLWVATVLVGCVNLAIDLLSDVEWRTATIGFLVTVPPMLLGVEVARQRSWSPASVWLAATQARQDGEATTLTAPPVINVTTINPNRT